VEPAPEIVPAAPLAAAAVVVLPLDELEELVVDDELELPHALTTSASITEPTTAPILFLITASPWLDYLISAMRAGETSRRPCIWSVS
jgi:hypothetical protein